MGRISQNTYCLLLPPHLTLYKQLATMRSPLALILIGCVVLIPKAALGITVPALCLVADCVPTPTPSISSAPSISSQPTTILQLQESYLRTTAQQEKRSSPIWLITSITGGVLLCLGSVVSFLVWKRGGIHNYEDEEEEDGGWFSRIFPFWSVGNHHDSWDEESSWGSDE